MTTTGTSEKLRIALQVSKPFMPGIMTSRRTTSGRSDRSFSMPSSPLDASETSYPRAIKAIFTARRAWGSSSTLRIFTVTKDLGRHWQRDGKDGAGARNARDPDPAAVCFQDALRAGQSQSCSRNVGPSGAAAKVSLEDPVLLPERDAPAAVGHADDNFGPCEFGGHGDG